MIPGFQRNHSGYQQIDVPLPADEERLYPSLERVERDHRVLPPPSDAPVVIAAPQVVPSAPMFAVNSHAQQAFAVAPRPMPAMQYQPPNGDGYVALRDDVSVPVPYGSQPGMPLPPPFEPFISDSAQAPPTIDELTDRIKNSSRAQFRIQGMFGYAWRFFGRNFCSFCGTQVIMLLILIGLSFALQAIFWSLFPDYNSHHVSRKRILYMFLIEYGFAVLFWLPLFLAMLYATLRAVQSNRFLMLGEFGKFFSQHYFRFFGFSLITSLLAFPFFMPFSFIGYFLYFFLFSFAAPLKFQYPQMRTCKAYFLSARISLKNWPKMLVLSILFILFNLLATLALFVGLFISIPVTMAVNVYVYHKLVGLHSVTGYARIVDALGEQYAYDGTGASVDQAVRHAQQQVQMQMQMQQPQMQQQLQAQPPQAQRVQYVQLVPVMRVSAPGILPPPIVSAGAPGGPAVIMRPSPVHSV